MDDKAKFEEEEDRFCLHPDGLERQMKSFTGRTAIAIGDF